MNKDIMKNDKAGDDLQSNLLAGDIQNIMLRYSDTYVIEVSDAIARYIKLHYTAKEIKPTTDIDEVREAVGVLTQGNQSGGTTKQSGTFVPTPNSGLMPVEKHKRYSAFIEWLDAMGWLRELTDGQENAIFEWFERTFEPYLKGGE